MRMTRRSVVKAALGGASVATLGAFAGGGAAANGVQATPAGPGFHRFKVGSIEVTAISDGYLPYTSDVTAARGGNLDMAQTSAAGRAVIPFTTLVVNTGSKLVLLDAGNGDLCAPTSGVWMENFRAAGFAPAKVDAVMISHFHGDHINGLRLKDGTAVFPNAEIMVPVVEWSYWMDTMRMAATPEEMHPAFSNARRVFGPLARHVRLLDWGKEPITGITTIAAPGHTQGHTAFALSSGKSSLLVLSDAASNPQALLRSPDAASMTDMDPEAARQTRRQLVDLALSEKMQMAFYHAALPAVVQIARDGAHFRLASTAGATLPRI